MQRAVGAQLGLLGLVLVGCIQGGNAAGDAGVTTTAAQTCSTDRVAAVVSEMLSALSNGEFAIDDYFSAVRFAWYSVDGVGGRSGTESQDRSTLTEYVDHRRSASESYSLVSMTITYQSEPPVGNLAFYLERSATDLPGSPVLVMGKGAISCDDERIIAWSVGGQAEVTIAEARSVCIGVSVAAEPPVCVAD